MQVVFYWWGFIVSIDDPTFQQLVSALQQGQTAVQNFLNQIGWGWLSPLVSALVSWGVAQLQAMKASCGARRLSLSVPWTVWNANIGCA
jgi:hypothetical protein